jgi:hypothetical protein
MTLRRTITIVASLTALVLTPAAADAKSFPEPPALPKGVKLERVKVQSGPFSSQLAPVRLSPDRPAESELFGAKGTYDGSKDILAQWVNYIYADAIPALGGTYSPPVYYGEVPDGSATGCRGTITRNAVYCPTNNAIMYTRSFMRGVFNRYGDAAFTAILAHEWGHGAQQWLGFGNYGKFRYTIYSEGFADCMSGGFMARMYNDGHLDGIGRGDLPEYLAYRAQSGSPTNDLNGHGTGKWRTDLVRYGWTNGMSGCAQWGYQLTQG